MKTISFDISDALYEGLINGPFSPSESDINGFFLACAINRMIERGYLNEFGDPVEYPKLDTDLIDFSSGLSMDSLRSINAVEK